MMHSVRWILRSLSLSLSLAGPGAASVPVAVAGPAALALASAPASTPAPAPHAAARCEVWARELSFARSVAGHDAAAFAAHVHPAAVFGPTRAEPLRGRDAIVAGWRGIIDGTALELQWYPDRVNPGGDPGLVASSGPALYRDLATGAYRLGRFNSVWQRGTDGTWRVVFDDGAGPPQAADAAQVEAFHRGRSEACAPG